VAKSKKDIYQILDLRPHEANRINNDQIEKIKSEDIVIGDEILVRTGETIPCDGTVIKGEGYVNSFMLDGESAPKNLQANGSVYTGTTLISGLLTIKVEKGYTDTVAAKIIAYMESGKDQAKSEEFITRFARVYTKIVVLLALLIAFVVPLVISLVNQTSYGDLILNYLKTSMVFLVVSCPCALVLSIPLTFFLGIGVSSKHNILIRSSGAVDKLTRINRFVFDKTGTLTKGSLMIEKMEHAPELTDEEFFQALAIAEQHSLHPIAVILKKMGTSEIKESSYNGYDDIAGKGIKTKYEGNEYWLGNAKLYLDSGITLPDLGHLSNSIFLAINGVYQGYLHFSDTIKVNSKRTIDTLLAQEKEVAMVTGDSEQSANEVASRLGITAIYSNCMPLDKVAVISKLQQKSNLVLFMGDGINDGPVLSNASVGVSMGAAGSDLAIEASDLIIMNDDPYQIIEAIRIAKLTKRIVIENIVLALGVKLLIMILSFIFPSMPAFVAVLGDSGLAMLCVVSSFRVLLYRSQKNLDQQKVIPAEK
jgi:Cd2+/Zn2+-exporting ATPase